jgi:hypothetical protein
VKNVDGILLDVGVVSFLWFFDKLSPHLSKSSMQIDASNRGFSFRKDRVGPLGTLSFSLSPFLSLLFFHLSFPVAS